MRKRIRVTAPKVCVKCGRTYYERDIYLGPNSRPSNTCSSTCFEAMYAKQSKASV